MNLSKPIGTVVIIILLFAGGFFFLLRGCLAKYNERSALPAILYFEKDDNPVLFSIVKFEKATSYSSKGSSTYKTVSTNYFIQANDALSGKKLAERKIKHHSDIKYHPIRVMGASDNTAWVFIGEVMAFNPYTLDKVADIEILEQKNPSLKGMFPGEERYYKFNPVDKHIYFTAKDGTTWVVNTKTLSASESRDMESTINEQVTIKQLEKQLKLNQQLQDSLYQQKLRNPSRMMQAKEITASRYQQLVKEYYEERKILDQNRDSMRQLQSRLEKRKRAGNDIQRKIESLSGHSTVHFSQVKSNQDTMDGKWYGLYADKELEKLYNRFQNQAAYDETARRKLFTAGYDADQDGDCLIDIENASNNSSAHFLDGGFLLDKQTGMPVHLAMPASYLIVDKTQVGNEGLIRVSRLQKDGKQLWAFNSGLKEWANYLRKDNRLFIVGTDNKELSSSDCNVLIVLDLETGKANRYDYFKDK